MQAREEPFDAILPDTSTRTEGIHLSNIIKWILTNLDPDTYKQGEISPELRALWEMGFIWEDAIADAMVRRYERSTSRMVVQQEVLMDGVYMTPDAFDLRAWLLHEYKFTRISSDRPITDVKFRHWLWQAKSYLRFYSATEAHVIVMHVMGNYRDKQFPVAKRWVLEFSHQEIEANWRMILGAKRSMEKERGE